MDRSTLSHPRLSPVNGKPILLGCDGADMSPDAGLTLLREIERKAGLAQRPAWPIHATRPRFSTAWTTSSARNARKLVMP